MAKFSDRMGITSPPSEFQINSISEELRYSLWNVIVKYYPIDYQNNRFRKFMEYLYFSFFKLPVTDLPYRDEDCRHSLENIFNSLKWFEIYNLMEVIVAYKEKDEKEKVIKEINYVLKTEYSGYTLIKGNFVPITNKEEIDSILEAQSLPETKGLKNISEHILKAASLLSKKPNPDYHNSIKESISAVEGVCKILTGNKSGGITGALTILSKKSKMHPSLREGYIKLYGYTSDEGGIRHPMLENNNVGFEEAKYMLVSCSAFVNYIIDKTKFE